MSTHGCFIYKDHDMVWGFHVLADGTSIIDFYNTYKNTQNPETVFRLALDFFADTEYNDCSTLNFFHCRADPTINYLNQSEFTLYWDGSKFWTNWSLEETH